MQTYNLENLKEIQAIESKGDCKIIYIYKDDSQKTAYFQGSKSFFDKALREAQFYLRSKHEWSQRDNSAWTL